MNVILGIGNFDLIKQFKSSKKAVYFEKNLLSSDLSPITRW